ncbi:MAG: STAS/SEC14 domain-containing protein [Burkholderiales bacterium]
MITVTNTDKLVTVTVLGEFTLTDFKQFEEAVEYAIKFQGKVNLLLDLSEMSAYTIDVAWEEIKFSRAHKADFEKVAVISSDQWTIWSAWVTKLFVDAEILVFDDSEPAGEWVAA